MKINNANSALEAMNVFKEKELKEEKDMNNNLLNQKILLQSLDEYKQTNQILMDYIKKTNKSSIINRVISILSLVLSIMIPIIIAICFK